LVAPESDSHSKVCFPIEGKLAPFGGSNRRKQEGVEVSVIVGEGICVAVRDGIGEGVIVALGCGISVFVLLGCR